MTGTRRLTGWAHSARGDGNSRAAVAFCALIAWMIVASTTLASEARHPDAVGVFHCKFDEAWDVNYDRWPDRWIRTTGADYPHYVGIAIQEDATAPGQKCLTIDLDGAAAAVASPPISVMSRFGYLFEAQIKTEALENSRVIVRLEFCDKAGRLLETRESKPLTNASGWRQIRIDKIELGNAEIDRVVIGLQAERGAKGDLKGRVSLADVWLARLPRIAVSTNSPCNVYPNPDDVIVRCALSGIREPNPEIRFQLFDALNDERDTGRFQLNGQLIAEDAQRTTDALDGIGEAPAGYVGSTEWRPKIPGYGFYRVVVKMISSRSPGETDEESELDNRTLWLAVVPPLEMPQRGEFGWSLPQGARPLSFLELSRLLPQVGVNWVKVPAWFDANDPRRGDDLIRFVELLGASNIEVVGVIDRPPAGSELANRLGRDATIADVLSPDTSTWSAALEPVMTRLSLRVRWWQLGRDGDVSFAGSPGLNKRIDELRTQLFRFGQDVRLGMSCDWASTEPGPSRVAWDFEQLYSNAPTTEKEFAELMSRPRTNSALRWILVEPPARTTVAPASDGAALDARSSEFVLRLVAAKQHGVDAIIVPNPFSDENGLMHADGGPAELLLPWRTTAAMLGGAKYLGQMQLPGGSENRIFLRPDGQVVMVVWSAEPTEEVLYLGNAVQHIDIWGCPTTPELNANEQIIDVGPLPAFVLGLNSAITQWRMTMAFGRDHVPSVFGKPHANSLRFKNCFPQGVGGSLRIVVPQSEHDDEYAASDERSPETSGFLPDRWSIEPPQKTFELAAGEEAEFPFDIRLKNALYGKQAVRIEFQIEADEPYQFSVYRDMEVGTEDLALMVKSHVDKDGMLVVEQLMKNNAKQLADFRCYLYAKGQRRQRMQVYRLGEHLDRKVYRYPDGRALVGQEMLLEIEELNGPRVLKYRFMANEKPEPGRSDATTDDEQMEMPHQSTARS